MDLGGDVLKLLLPCQSPLLYQGVALARSSSLKTGTDCDRPSDAVKSLNSEAAKTDEATRQAGANVATPARSPRTSSPLARSKYEQNARNNTLKGLANEPSPQRSPPSVSRTTPRRDHLPKTRSTTTIIIHDRARAQPRRRPLRLRPRVRAERHLAWRQDTQKTRPVTHYLDRL